MTSPSHAQLRYKTSLCKHTKKKAPCPYLRVSEGSVVDKCLFAHSREEMGRWRSISRLRVLLETVEDLAPDVMFQARLKAPRMVLGKHMPPVQEQPPVLKQPNYYEGDWWQRQTLMCALAEDEQKIDEIVASFFGRSF